MARNKNVLTTGQVAKICNVAPRTVSKWFDSGQLKGYRIPGSKDRRIPLNELTAFMKAHDIPITGFNGDNLRVLIVDDNRQAASKLAEALKTTANYDVQIADSNFETGLAVQQFSPHVLLINLFAKGISAVDICQSIRANETLHNTRIIAIANQLSYSEAQALLQKGFDNYVCDYSNFTEIIQKIEEKTAVLA